MCRILMFSMLFLSPCSHLPEICQVCLTLGVPLLSVTEWCVSAPLLAVVLSQGCSALPRSVSCNWLASADCAMDACSACVLGKLVSRMSLQSRPQSCFPNTLLAISVALKMPAPGQALVRYVLNMPSVFMPHRVLQNEDAALCSCSQMTHYFWFHQLHLGYVKSQ